MQSGMDTNYLVVDQKVNNGMYCSILKKLEIGNSFGNVPLGAEVSMMGKISLKPRNGVRQIFGLPNLSPVNQRSRFKCFPVMMELTVSRNTAQKVRRYGTEIGFGGHGALGQRLDVMILEVFPT